MYFGILIKDSKICCLTACIIGKCVLITEIAVNNHLPLITSNQCNTKYTKNPKFKKYEENILYGILELEDRGDMTETSDLDIKSLFKL